MIERYGPLFEEVKTKSRWTTTIFIEQAVRRAIFLVIMFYIESATIQIIFLSFMNIAHAIYFGTLKPRSMPELNTIELVNEWFF